MNILVVEDEPAVRDSVRRALELKGYRVEAAVDGPKALIAARGTERDAIVLDVMLPGLDGLEVCRRLRGDGNTVPNLMLTARDAIGDRVAGLDAGADDYLVKPFALTRFCLGTGPSAAPRMRRRLSRRVMEHARILTTCARGSYPSPATGERTP